MAKLTKEEKAKRYDKILQQTQKRVEKFRKKK